MVLVIHRNQSDPEGEDKMMKKSDMLDIMSGLHLGKHDQALHMLKINVYGGSDDHAELLFDSNVNRQNQDKVLQLLQESMPVST